MDLKDRLLWYERRLQEIGEESKAHDGKIKRHDFWRCEYYRRPYLAGATDDQIRARFCDVFFNVFDLDELGRFTPTAESFVDARFFQRFTHLLEEYGGRGGLPADVIRSARAPMLKYLDAQEPQRRAWLNSSAGQVLVKYSKRQYLEETVRYGRLRVSPASYYNDINHISAIRDCEAERLLIIPTFDERMRGEKSIKYNGAELKFGDSDLEITLISNNYYLYCLCTGLHYRLPIDFEADSALVISDPRRFQRIFSKALRKEFPKSKLRWGEVYYYDPYTDYDKVTDPVMTKHFRYHYQREFRIVIDPRDGGANDWEPIYLELGDLRDLASIVAVV
jgi:hypothetical protein